MADLQLRFEDVIEEHYDEQLQMIREFARRFQERGPHQHVCVEVGSNRGKFLAALAGQHPARSYLGIELRKKFAETAQRRLQRHGLENANCLRADANHVLPIVLDDGQLDELFLLYPDPWWKAKHHKRRIIQPEFLDMLHQKMRPGAKLWIRTDVAPLARDMRATLQEHPHFEDLDLFDFPMLPFPHTTRERHCIANNVPAHLLYYEHRA